MKTHQSDRNLVFPRSFSFTILPLLPPRNECFHLEIETARLTRPYVRRGRAFFLLQRRKGRRFVHLHVMNNYEAPSGAAGAAGLF